MEGPNTLYLRVAQKCIQIIRNLTIPNVVCASLLSRELISQIPFFYSWKAPSVSCIHIINLNQRNLFLYHKLAQERKLTNMASTSHLVI